MVYVAGSGRPVHEILAPAEPRNEARYHDEFAGMTQEPVTMEELRTVRDKLHTDIRTRLTGDIAGFLFSLHNAAPDFNLIGLPEAATLPAVRWKIRNLAWLKRNNPHKHAVQREATESMLQ